MTIEQTVEVPASRRVFFDLPLSFPVGTANAALVLFPKTEEAAHAQFKKVPVKAEDAAFAKKPGRMTAREAIEASAGIAKRLGAHLSSNRLLEMRREDKELEEAQYRRLFHHEGDA